MGSLADQFDIFVEEYIKEIGESATHTIVLPQLAEFLVRDDQLSVDARYLLIETDLLLLSGRNNPLFLYVGLDGGFTPRICHNSLSFAAYSLADQIPSKIPFILCRGSRNKYQDMLGFELNCNNF